MDSQENKQFVEQFTDVNEHNELVRTRREVLSSDKCPIGYKRLYKICVPK